MKTRALRWWSRAALDEAAALVEHGWSRWCANWNVMPGAVSAANAFECEAFDETPPAWQVLAGGGPSVWLALAGAEPVAGVRALLFSTSRPRSEVAHVAGAKPAGASFVTSLADEVAAVAWANLQQEMMAALKAAGDLDGAEMPVQNDGLGSLPSPNPPRPQSWSGDLRVRLESPQQRDLHIDLFVAATRAETLLRTRPRRSLTPPATVEPIQRIADAVRDQSIRLRIELSGVALDLGTLQSLQVGDVVSLPHRLNDALHVQTAPGALVGGQRRLGSAHLGSRDGHRAIELTRDPVVA